MSFSTGSVRSPFYFDDYTENKLRTYLWFDYMLVLIIGNMMSHKRDQVQFDIELTSKPMVMGNYDGMYCTFSTLQNCYKLSFKNVLTF